MKTQYEYEEKMRVKFYDVLKDYNRIPGYSPSQVVSVMIVLDCNEQEAIRLLDNPEMDSLDWSEVSWTELREFMTEMIGA